MTLNDDIARFSTIHLFEGFPDEQLRLLAFGSKRIFLRAGEELFQAGQYSDGGYIVISGQIDVVADREGRETVLSSQLENSLIGEMALIIANKCIATAIARTNCELLQIPRELFKRMLAEYPELAILIHGRIQKTVEELLNKMSNVQTKLSNIPNLAADNSPDLETTEPNSD